MVQRVDSILNKKTSTMEMYHNKENEGSDTATWKEEEEVEVDVKPSMYIPLVLSTMPTLEPTFEVDSSKESLVMAGIEQMTSEDLMTSCFTESQEKPTIYNCKICNESFKKRWMLNKHNKRKHKMNDVELMDSYEEGLGATAFVCHVCGLDLKKAVDFRKHIQMHENHGIFKCGVCHLQFNDSVALSQHQLAEQHGNIPQIQVENKKRKFKRVRFNCPYCGKEFYEKSHYQLHYRTHSGERPYTCGICSKDFAGTGGLREHMKIHTGEKNHKCPECGKGFYGPSKLKNHMRIHTGDRPYKCIYCGKGFIESGKLKRHLRIHTGEQPYSCPVCGRGFNVISNLSKHMIVHTGVKPYPCEICGKAFAQKINMQVHMKIHSANNKKSSKGNIEKSRDGQHVCDICGNSFKKAKDLKTHRKIHKKNNDKMELELLKSEEVGFQHIVLLPEDVSVDSTLAKLNDTENFKFRLKGRVKRDQTGVGKLLDSKEIGESNGTSPEEFDLGDPKELGGTLLNVETSNTLPSNFLADIQIKAEPLEYDFELEDSSYMEQFDPSLEQSLVDSYTECSFKREDDLSNESETPMTDQFNEEMSLPNHDFRVKVEPYDSIDAVQRDSAFDSDLKGMPELNNDDVKPFKPKRNSAKPKKLVEKSVAHGKSKRQRALKSKRHISESLSSEGDYTCPGCRKSFTNKQKLAIHSMSCDEEADLSC